MREETGLETTVGRLLYICDHPTADVLHVTFETHVVGGVLGQTAGMDTRTIRAVQYVPVADLTAHGYSAQFQDLAASGFPGAGSYMGLKSNIGL
jgi:ADP-ribose pyrophosphatase YjhB (NUDIX family)